MMSNFESKFNQNNLPDVGRIIDESFETFKKTVWVSGVGIFIISLLIFPITFYTIFKILDISTFEEYVKLIPTLGQNINYILTTSALGICLSGFTAIFIAGLYKINHLASQNKEFGMNNLFDYLKNPYFINLFLSGFLTTLYSNVLALGLIFLNIPIGAMVIQLFVFVLFIFSIPLIIFENQTTLQAMSNSSKVAMKNLFAILVCIVFGIIIAILGGFAICIGLFFTIGYIYTINYTLYNQIIPTDKIDKK